MNYCLFVGRLTTDPEVKQTSDGNYLVYITIAVSRDYKNSEGVYDADFIRCILWNGIASATKDYCHKGDIVGVKGRLQNHVYLKNEEKKYVLEVVADKVSFLSTASVK